MEATIGGTRRHLVDVARGQRELGLDVHVAVATSRDPDFPADLDALEAEGVGVTRLPMVREISPRADWRDARSLMGLLRSLRPDVVHTHSSKAGVLGRIASVRSGIGLRVHTPHTFAFLFEALFGRAKRALFRQVETRLSHYTERVIAVSESEAETFARSGVVAPERIRVVKNGVRSAQFENVAACDLSSLDLDPSAPIAAVIGLLYAAKGQDLALECLARPGCESLQLLIVGPGESAQLKALAIARGVAERVRFLGARRDVPAILAALDFLLLPSRWEGMPYVVLEAMASGLPVVATPVDGARELVVDGESGVLADGIALEPLHAALARMCALSADERRVLGNSGRSRVVDDYSIERMVQGLSTVYDEALGARVAS
ncbi:MAG: glycosyltransferase involved in cell wall biosynthesis [Chlamydiales bacterium]|jgi:glycosyltransferase involved in cell wall biosynthesis